MDFYTRRPYGNVNSDYRLQNSLEFWFRYILSIYNVICFKHLKSNQFITTMYMTDSNTPFTLGLRPLCLPWATTKLARSPLKAEKRPDDCLGRSGKVHRTFRQRHGRHGRRKFRAKQTHKGRWGGRTLTGRSKEAGGRHTHRRGRRMDAQWSAIGRPVKKCVLLWTLCIKLSDASAFIVPPLCLLLPTNSVQWGFTVATTVAPFGDHGNHWATLAMVLPPLCPLCATFCATTAALVVQGRHRDRVAAVTQKQNFLGLGDHWAS